MKFAEIIREAGINPSDVPHVAELSIVLYDGKKREIKEETIRFAEPLFEQNQLARSDFLKFLVELEKKIRENEDFAQSLSLRVQITKALLLVGSDLETPNVFPRDPY